MAEQLPQNLLTQSPFIDPEQQQALTELQRKQQLANLLTQQGMQAPQGQVVSGRYVAPNPLQYLSNMFSTYSGQQMTKDIGKEQARLANALRETEAADVESMLSAIKEGKQTEAIGIGTKSASPFARSIASKLVERQFKEPKWEKAELTDPKTGNTRQGWVDVNSPNPEATFRQGGEKPAIGPMDVMKGRFEGWYTGNVPTGGTMPTGGVSGGGMVSTGGVPTGGAPTAGFGGLSPQASIEANKQLVVDKLKRQQEFAEKAPAAIQQMQQTLTNINDLIGDTKVENGKVVYGKQKPHPGFESAVGISAAPLSGFIPGTDTTDFKERMAQIKGQSFLQAFENLKGAGQITEIEGAKATAALNRMSLSQSEAEFVKAAREFEDNVRKGMELAAKRAGIPQQGGWRVK